MQNNEYHFAFNFALFQLSICTSLCCTQLMFYTEIFRQNSERPIRPSRCFFGCNSLTQVSDIRFQRSRTSANYFQDVFNYFMDLLSKCCDLISHLKLANYKNKTEQNILYAYIIILSETLKHF